MSKRFFDVTLALVISFFLILPMLFVWILISVETKSNGLFCQQRIGQYGNKFIIYKFRTILWDYEEPRATRLGRYLRKYKIDEWPQLFNILNGTMSFVGPRPDLEGFYDSLEGEERKVLLLRPGLTSRASLVFFNEEALLSKQEDPIGYNKKIVFPEKVAMNLNYYYDNSVAKDLVIIKETLFYFVKLLFK